MLPYVSRSQFAAFQVFLVASCLAALATSGRADTVYLKNGAWIDGVVFPRTDSVMVQIGDVGSIEIERDDIYAIEKNGLTGRESSVPVEARSVELSGEAKDESSGVVDSDEGSSADKESSDGDEAAEEGAQATEKKDEEAEKIDPALQASIEAEIVELKRQKAKFRIRAERKLKSIGLPAVPFLVPVARHDNEFTRIAVMRIFESVGDDRVLDACIEALLDTNEYVRDFSNRALKRITQRDFGYIASSSPRRRRFAQQKWARWWTAEKEARAAAEDEDEQEEDDENGNVDDADRTENDA